MEIKTKYDIQQVVFLSHDPDQLARMIIEIRIISPKIHKYVLVCGAEESDHYHYEISGEANIVTKTTN